MNGSREKIGRAFGEGLQHSRDKRYNVKGDLSQSVSNGLRCQTGRAGGPANVLAQLRSGTRAVFREPGETAMASPFPGMDPYLESFELWPAFHHQLVTCLYQILLPGLVDRYKARVGKRSYTTEQALFTSIIHEEHHEEYIEIRQRNEGRLGTPVDVVSPANKTNPSGRQSYLDKRR